MRWLSFCCGYISQARLSLSAARPILKLKRPRRMAVAQTKGGMRKVAAEARAVPTVRVALSVRMLRQFLCVPQALLARR